MLSTTNTSISLLAAVACCLFFGNKCARTLNRHIPNPRRQRRGRVLCGGLQLFQLGRGREHAYERLAFIRVVQVGRTASQILPSGLRLLLGPRSPLLGPGYHGLTYAIKTCGSTGLEGSSDQVGMVIVTSCQPLQRNPNPALHLSPPRARSAADRSPSAAAFASSARATSCRARRRTRTCRRTSSTSSPTSARAQIFPRGACAVSILKGCSSGSPGRETP